MNTPAPKTIARPGHAPVVLLARFWIGCLLLPVGMSAHADTVEARCDIYPKGSDQASQVLPCIYSQRQGYVSITRADGVRHELSPLRGAGNYVDQDGKRALRSAGLGRAGQIYRLAHETIYVYWDTAGLLDKAESLPPESTASKRPAAALPPVPFDQSLELQGVSFRVTSTNHGPVNELTIAPSGLRIDNTPIVRSIAGQIVRAELADINADGSPEVYVYIALTGPAPRASLVAYSANKRKSLSEIHLPQETQATSSTNGYRGHDEFSVVENTLVQRFPVYRTGDADDAPSGGMRQLQYKLKAGEASWVLRLDRIVNY